MTLRALFRGFASFRARVFWSVIPIVVLFLVFQGWMNVREHRRLITDEFEKRGRALASNLGFASELGVFSEDRQLLETAIRGALRDPDIGYVVIQSSAGKVLADGGRQIALAGRAVDAVIDRPLSRRVQRADQRFIEFVSPIVAEAAQAPEEFLIETRAGSGTQPSGGRVIGAVRLGLSLAGVERQTWELTKLWGGITLAFLVVGTFLIYGFSRRITNPIKRLTQEAQKIAAGRLEEQIPVQSRDEIGQLATSFNRMTGALKVSVDERERALAELQELNRTLEDRIRQRTSELEERGAELQRSLEEVRALGEVSRALGSTVHLEDVLSTISTHALRLSNADACGIFELDADSERWRLVASSNVGAGVLGMLGGAPGAGGRSARAGPMGEALSSGHPVQVADIEASSLPDRDGYLRAGFRAVLAVPMGSADVSHVMALYRREPRQFDDRTVDLLTTLANQSNVAIENARLFEEVEAKSRQLEAASRHKSDFLANVSHELRTPMNAILGFNEMILDSIYGDVPEELKRPLTDMQNSGQHLLRLINDVLDLSKIEAGRMELILADYSVRDTVEAVRASLGSLAAEKGLEFVTAVPEDVPLAHGDGKRLTQCLMNLAGNALKFTRAGRVEIAVEHRGETLVFRVADTGIGIPREQIDGLFTEFQQGDSAIAREFGGTGLGLSIAKKFVEMHGGRIWVESEVGQGSTFFFSIPLHVEAGRAA